MNQVRTDTLRQLEHEVGVVIRRVKRVIGERARAVHPELQPGTYLMLTYLAETGSCRSSSIAEVFDMDKGAISRQVQHLTDLGLVERSPDPADGRASLLSLTDEAHRRLDDVQAHRRKVIDERLADWSDEDLHSFVEMLGRYNATLD